MDKLGRHSSNERRLSVGFILARSFTLSAFSLFVDTIRLASGIGDKSGRRFADWRVMSSAGHLVSSSCGVQVSPTSKFVDPNQFHYIVVVGGLLGATSPLDDATVGYLRDAGSSRACLLGLCTGSFILADAGLMEDHVTCVSWLHYDAFREQFPQLRARPDHIFNLDLRRGSCAGGSSVADLAATIVQRHIGREAERNALEVLQIPRARKSDDIQTRRPLAITSDDSRLRAALIVMETHLGRRLTIKELADSVGMSRRALERIFFKETQSSPASVYRQVRLSRARRLLSETKASLIDIALDVGFGNAGHFARAFRERFGTSPTAFRANAETPLRYGCTAPNEPYHQDWHA